MQETQIRSLGWEDPLEKGMTPTPVFLPGESHGQRSLVGYSPRDCKELDTTEATEHTRMRVITFGPTRIIQDISLWGRGAGLSCSL